MSWKGGNKTDKYEKCAESLMKLGDSIIAERKRKIKIIRRISFSLSGLCVAVLLSVSLYQIQTPTDIKQFEQKIDVIEPTTADIHTDTPHTSTEPPVTATTSSENQFTEVTVAVQTTENSTNLNTIPLTETYISYESVVSDSYETVASETEQPELNVEVQTEPPPIEEPTEIIPVTPEIPVTPTDIPDYSEHYRSFKADNSEILYTRVSGTVSESAVYELIGTQELSEQAENGEISCNAELFSLKGISPQAFISVRYENTADFVLYQNQDYKPDTLGDFIGDYGIETYGVFDSAEYSDFTDGYQLRTYQGFESEKIIDFLLESSDAECYSYSDLPPEQIIPEINIICDMNSVIPLKSGFGVSEKGYLTTNLTGGGIVFDIGKEKVVNIINYITENFPYTVLSEDNKIKNTPNME